MRKLLFYLFLLVPTVAFSAVTLPHAQHWNTVSPWAQTYSGSALDATQSADGSPSTSLKFTYPSGMFNGTAPDKVWVSWTTEQDEIWVEYWFKYSSGFYFHPIMNKQSYVYNYGATNTNFFVGLNGSKVMTMQNQRQDGGAGSRSGGPVIATNTWYKVTYRAVVNTVDTPANGIFQLWVNDAIAINVSNVKYTSTADPDLGYGWSSMALEPVFGGNLPTTDSRAYKPAADYTWYDYVRIQTTAFDNGVDQSPPYVDTFSPADNTTGVAKTTTSVSWHVRDAGDGVDNTTVTVACSSPSIATKTCGDTNFSCTGTSANYTATLGGLSLSYSQAVSCTLNASDLASPVNAMGAYTYNFTVESDPGTALNITTTSLDNGTVSRSYTDNVEATGGTTPYTWSVSGSLPTGLSLNTGTGAITGTPTTSGTSSFTVIVTDSASPANTDNQALSIYIAPYVDNTTLGPGINDTYINGGAGYKDTNYYTDNVMKAYQWPYGSVINRIILIDNTDITAIPAGWTIETARLQLYMVSYEGSGGTNPLPVSVYIISGTLPVISTVTWNNFAGTLSAALDTEYVTLTPGWVEWDVTSAVVAAHAGGIPLYLALDAGGNGAADSNRNFVTKQYPDESLHPKLVVVANSTPRAASPGKIRAGGFKGTFR